MIPTVIESVDLKDQRYLTLGDYMHKDGVRYFKITKTGNDLYDDLILIHEMVEEVLTRHKGIKEEDITKFDMWFEQEINAGRQNDDAEPGSHPDAPYVHEHMAAEIVEALMLNHLGISLKEYNDYIIKAFSDADNK